MTKGATTRRHLLGAMAATAAVPAMAFAASNGGGDAKIIAAYAEHCRLTALFYLDEGKESRLTQAEEDAIDARRLTLEKIIETTPATTPEGAACRLLLVFVGDFPDRWIERTLARQGFEALYTRRSELEPMARQMIEAVHDLKQMGRRA